MREKKLWKAICLTVMILVMLVLFGDQRTAYASEEDWPMMMPGNSWFDKFKINRVNIRKIEFRTDYQPNGFEMETHNVDIGNTGKIKAYVLSDRRTLIVARTEGGCFIANRNMSEMFSGFSTLKEVVGFNSLRTNKVEDMSFMFYECGLLESIDLENIDIQNVKYMDSMFQSCCMLCNVSISQWQIKEVQTVNSMFKNCASLKSISLPSLEETKLKNMSNMFANCYDLETIDLSGVNTKYVTDMSGMFSNCCSLQEIDLSEWDTSNLSDIHQMFSGCESLKSLKIDDLDTKHVKDYSGLFENCKTLESIDISSWDMKEANNINSMFSGCESLRQLDDLYIFSNVVSAENMFKNCKTLATLDVSGIRGYQLSSVNGMFDGCSGLEELDLGLYLGNVLQNNQNGIFGNGTFPKLTKITFPTGVKITIPLPETGSGHFEYQGKEINMLPMDLSTPLELAVRHRVLFLDSEDGAVITSVMVDRGSSVLIPDTPEKESPEFEYSFQSWNDENEQPYDFSMSIYSDQVIYASWEKRDRWYLVTFDPDNGFPVDTCSVAYGKKVAEPMEPERAATLENTYQFIGWYHQGRLFDFQTEIIKNTELKAVWKEVPVKTSETVPVENEETEGRTQQKEQEEKGKREEQEKEQPDEQPDEQSDEQQDEQPDEQPNEQSDEQPDEQSNEQPDEQSNEQPDEQPNEQPDEQPDEQNKTVNETKQENGAAEKDEKENSSSGAEENNTKKNGSGSGSENSGGNNTSTGGGSIGDSGGSSGGGRDSSGSSSGSSGGGGGSSGGSSGGGGGSYVSNGRTPSGTKITVAGSYITFSSFWYTDNKGKWRIQNRDGKMLTSCWLCDDAVAENGKEVWYLIGTDGEMLSCGLVQDNTGNFYSLEMTHNGYFGMLRYKNGFYRCGTETLYITFEHSHNGSFGAITSKNALEAMKKQYGITRFPIGNQNCIYTSTF